MTALVPPPDGTGVAENPPEVDWRSDPAHAPRLGVEVPAIVGANRLPDDKCVVEYPPEVDWRSDSAHVPRLALLGAEVPAIVGVPSPPLLCETASDIVAPRCHEPLAAVRARDSPPGSSLLGANEPGDDRRLDRDPCEGIC